MYKTYSTNNNSQIFESKIKEKNIDTVIIYYQNREQLPTLDLPDKDLILICKDSNDIMEGDIQMNFFFKSILFVNRDAYLDILKRKKIFHLDEHSSFSKNIMSYTVRHMNQNVLNCVEAACIAFELELIDKDKPVLAMGGLMQNLDTLIVVTPAKYSKIENAKVNEVICEPIIEA